jgi:hypothetical protein
VITPNKVISVSESALGRAAVILERGPGPVDIASLFSVVSGKFESIDQFILALDVLYVLGRINVDFERRELTYAS